jgi:serine O-acetyltransferase
MLKKIREDIAIVFERDPAARTTLEVLTTYPGVHALLIHRLAHAFWQIKLPLVVVCLLIMAWVL